MKCEAKQSSVMVTVSTGECRACHGHVWLNYTGLLHRHLGADDATECPGGGSSPVAQTAPEVQP